MANPRTIRLAGSGTDTQQYELAPGLIQYVQSVRVVVDNSGGGDATPTLSISEQSGVVIADVPQNGVLPAGEADGAATWALRLVDDAVRSSGGITMQRGVYNNDTQDVTSGTTTNASIAYLSGAALLDLTFPDFPSFIAAGNYLVSGYLLAPSGAGFTGKTATIRPYHTSLAGDDGLSVGNTATLDATYSRQASAFFPYVAQAGDRITFAIDHNIGTAGVTVVTFGVCVIVVKLS